MLGATRGVTPSLAGWLWADILLGLFVIFLAASGAPFHATDTASPTPTPTPSVLGIDPTPFVTTLQVDGTALLGANANAAAAEQLRVSQEIAGRTATAHPGRRVAIVLAYGTHQDPIEGDRLVRQATKTLNTGAFAGATVKAYHDLVPGDQGSTLIVEVFLYQ